MVITNLGLSGASSPFLITKMASEAWSKFSYFLLNRKLSPITVVLALQTFPELVKLKSSEWNEKEDCIPPQDLVTWRGHSVHQALVPDYYEYYSPCSRASSRGSQIFINQPWIMLSPHCCWISFKEKQIFLIGIFLVWGEGRADARYTNRNAFSKVALGKGRKAGLMKSV